MLFVLVPSVYVAVTFVSPLVVGINTDTFATPLFTNAMKFNPFTFIVTNPFVMLFPLLSVTLNTA